MTLYEQYQKRNIDTAPIGLEAGSTQSTYFCTPKGARVLGWAGVDGIHFCFVETFGEMVFSVNPMALPGEYVHPAAKNFADFLSLLLACNDTAAIEQAHGSEPEQFNDFLKQNLPTAAQSVALNEIQQSFALTPMKEPFAYLKALQADFDYDSVPYSAEYMEAMPQEIKTPEWEVHFNSGFWGHEDDGHAGIELPVGKQFHWGEESWNIPAVYICGAGLVIDFCVEIDPAKIQAFQDRWDLGEEQETARTDIERMQMVLENPLQIDIRLQANVNGRTLTSSHGCATCWVPSRAGDLPCDDEAQRVLEHCHCDPSRGWIFSRHALPWVTKRKPRMKSLALTMEQMRVSIPGISFTVTQPGEQIECTHPVTGVIHTLTVVELEPQEMTMEHTFDDSLEWPVHYVQMTYKLSPELPDGAYSVCDCQTSDAPKPKKLTDISDSSSNCAAVGIIGGADGPTAIFLAGQSTETLHTTYSALHFEPVDDVAWRVVFREKMREDIAVTVM